MSAIGRADPLVIRPRPNGLRMRLLTRELSQPLVVISLLIMVAGVARAVFGGSWSRGMLTALAIPAFVVVVVGYLHLYFRNVSFSIVGGNLVRTGAFGAKRSVPTTAIRRFVRLCVTSTYGGVSQVLVLGESDRCLMSIGRSDEYAISDLNNLASASGSAVIDGGTVDAPEFARRYPGAISSFGSFVIRLSKRQRRLQVIVFLLTVLAFVVYGIVLGVTAHE